MATTSIWRVNGWLGKVLIYIENPDKTENPAAYEKQGMDGKEAQGLSDVIEYAVQQKKTGKIAVDDEDVPVMQRFVSGVNCSPTTARDEMIAVKKRLRRALSGRKLRRWHFRQSGVVRPPHEQRHNVLRPVQVCKRGFLPGA